MTEFTVSSASAIPSVVPSTYPPFDIFAPQFIKTMQSLKSDVGKANTRALLEGGQHLYDNFEFKPEIYILKPVFE